MLIHSLLLGVAILHGSWFVTVGGGVGRCEFVDESFFLGSSGQISHGTGGALTPLSTREGGRERGGGRE